MFTVEELKLEMRQRFIFSLQYIQFFTVDSTKETKTIDNLIQ